jgi:hypothetical protein
MNNLNMSTAVEVHRDSSYAFGSFCKFPFHGERRREAAAPAAGRKLPRLLNKHKLSTIQPLPLHQLSNAITGPDLKLSSRINKPQTTFPAASMGTREASHAGSWYEEDPSELSQQLDEFLARVPETLDNSSLPIPGARVIIAP